MAQNEEFSAIFDKFANYLESKLSSNSNVSHFEILGSASKSTDIEVESGFIKDSYKREGQGIGVRVINSSGQEGHVYTTILNSETIEKCMINALKMMKASTKNPDLRDIAHKPSLGYTSVQENIFDKRIDDMSIDEINEKFQPIFDLKKRKLPPTGLSASFSTSTGVFHIRNSNGIQCNEKSATSSVSANVTLIKDNIPGNGFDWQSVVNLSDQDVEKVANKAYEMAEKGLVKSSVPTGKYPVILSPIGAISFLIGPIIDGIDAEQIQNKKSFMIDKINNNLMNEKNQKLLNIIDDPFIPWKMGSESFDGEGTATKKTEIISNGTLNTYLHNSFTAGKEGGGLVSTGHGSRSGYASTLGISSHNIVMKEGNSGIGDIIGDIKKGIVLEYTGDRPNMVTGDFSGLIMIGYIIENGEIGPSLQETLIGANLLESIQKITEISKETEWIDNYKIPWIKLDDISISSRD